MTVLHVACLPFPTYQGTQAAIAEMLASSEEHGRKPHLLTYSERAYDIDLPYRIDRITDSPRVPSLRSGPSWGKLVLDVRAVMHLRRLAGELRPKAVVAHHVEAAMAALAARTGPVHYVAHTSLAEELPTYFPGLPAAALAAAARSVEGTVCRRAASVAAVSPDLAARLGTATHLPIPWRVAAKAVLTSSKARRRLTIPDNPTALYAGNLDRYQGWEHLIDALAALRQTIPTAQLLIATESNPAPARGHAARAGLSDAVWFHGLAGECDRRQVHAAADFAWVPRRTPGGLPVKMLDAFARGLPVIAMKRATAGLAVDQICISVPNDDGSALAAAAHRLLADTAHADRLRSASLQYLERFHSSKVFDDAMQRFLELKVRSAQAIRQTPLST